MLTKRERQVAERLLMGERNGEIARALKLKPYTVRNYLRHMTVKLGISNRFHVRIRLAYFLHAYRKELGIKCTCD